MGEEIEFEFILKCFFISAGLWFFVNFLFNGKRVANLFYIYSIMNKVLVIIILLLFTSAILSCKKENSCSTCVVKNDQNQVTKNYGEKCGTATDVDNYESSARNDAAQLSGTFSCDRH